MDGNRVLGDDLDRAVILDANDAAAHHLPFGEVDEDVVAPPPTGFWLVHVDQDAPAG
jgi:hypothetical protein